MIPDNPPRTKRELFERLRNVLDAGWQIMPNKRRYNGTGAPGNFLEDLLGLTAGNLDMPDSVGWELKYYTQKTSLITLFHKEPQPQTVMRYMVSRYGWKDSHGRLSFRHTIRGRSDRFRVFADTGRIVVRPLKGNGIVPHWTDEILMNIAASKLRRLLLVKGERRNTRGVRFYQADCFENLQLAFFTAEVVNGTVCIDFDCRELTPGSRGLRNHGTKFRIPPENICRIYMRKERFA